MNRLDFFKRLFGIAIIPILPELPKQTHNIIHDAECKECVTSKCAPPQTCYSDTGRCVDCIDDEPEFNYVPGAYSPRGFIPVNNLPKGSSYAKIKVHKSYNHRRV